MFNWAVAEILGEDDRSMKLELVDVLEPVRPEMIILLSARRLQFVEMVAVRMFLAPGMSWLCSMVDTMNVGLKIRSAAAPPSTPARTYNHTRCVSMVTINLISKARYGGVIQICLQSIFVFLFYFVCIFLMHRMQA